MSWAFAGTMVKETGKEQYCFPYVFAAPPDVTDEAMLKQALWLKNNGFRADRLQAFVPSPMAMAMYHPAGKPLSKATAGNEGVYVPKGLRQRRLQKRRRLHQAFLRYHDPYNWPLLRGALRRMGRADLIGPGRHQLIPASQPDQNESGARTRTAGRLRGSSWMHQSSTFRF